MTKAREEKAGKRDEERQPLARGERASERGRDGSAAHAGEPGRLSAPSGDSHVEGQATLLRNGRLHRTQRRTLVARIGRQLGNTYLQRLIQQAAERRRGHALVQRQTNVGPDRAEWRYHNDQLQMRRSPTDTWSTQRGRPTFGRYQRLQEAMEQVAVRETR